MVSGAHRWRPQQQREQHTGDDEYHQQQVAHTLIIGVKQEFFDRLAEKPSKNTG